MRPAERLDYRIRRPIELRAARATCEEVDCPSWRHGWVSVLDERTEAGRGHAEWIRSASGLTFTTEFDGAGFTRFTFEPGQACFARTTHRIEDRRIEHDPRFLRRSSWGSTRQLSAESWQDDFATETDRLRTFIERIG